MKYFAQQIKNIHKKILVNSLIFLIKYVILISTNKQRNGIYMKKVILLLILTAFIGGGILCAPAIFEEFLPKTAITQLKELEFIDSVSATGSVEQKSPNIISASSAVAIAAVCVSEGQVINSGDVVATVDKPATAKRMMEGSDYAKLAAIGVGAGSYEDILAMIPADITASVSGTVDSITVSAGDYIEAGTAIATLIGNDNLIVKASISENAIGDIAVGQAVIITGNGFSGREYSGVVESIAPIATKQYIGAAQDTVVDVKIRFSDADSAIRAGYSAKVKILTSEQKHVGVLPYEAVMEDENGGEYVYVFSGGLAVKREVKTGLELGAGVQVVDGVNGDDKILTAPENITDGEYVKIVN